MTFTARASSVVPCNVSGMASSSGLTAGRCSDAYVNTNADDMLSAAGMFVTGTTPSAGVIEVWAFAERADGVWPELFSGAYTGVEATLTAVSRDVLLAGAAQVAIMATDTTTNRNYPFRPRNLVDLLGGPIHKVAFFVTHNTGVLLSATSSHTISVKPDYWA